MKTKNRIRIIASIPADEGQEGIEEYIGEELDVVAWWKSKTNSLEDGEIQVILRSEKDLNINGQLSVLNKNEYEFI